MLPRQILEISDFSWKSRKRRKQGKRQLGFGHKNQGYCSNLYFWNVLANRGTRVDGQTDVQAYGPMDRKTYEQSNIRADGQIDRRTHMAVQTAINC